MRGDGFDLLVVCGFAFDPHSGETEEINRLIKLRPTSTRVTDTSSAWEPHWSTLPVRPGLRLWVAKPRSEESGPDSQKVRPLGIPLVGVRNPRSWSCATRTLAAEVHHPQKTNVVPTTC